MEDMTARVNDIEEVETTTGVEERTPVPALWSRGSSEGSSLTP